MEPVQLDLDGFGFEDTVEIEDEWFKEICKDLPFYGSPSAVSEPDSLSYIWDSSNRLVPSKAFDISETRDEMSLARLLTSFVKAKV